jgi:hypothetical protein
MTTKNGNLPAMPVNVGALYESRTDKGSWELASLGLTKREMFAMAAMQGILAKGGSGKMVSERAVDYADELLAELEAAK